MVGRKVVADQKRRKPERLGLARLLTPGRRAAECLIDYPESERSQRHGQWPPGREARQLALLRAAHNLVGQGRCRYRILALEFGLGALD
jgi:hypothetical protein